MLNSSRRVNDIELPVVGTAGLLSTIEEHSAWPLPVTRVSDTVYPVTDRLNSDRVQEMVTDVAVGGDTVMVGLMMPLLHYGIK